MNYEIHRYKNNRSGRIRGFLMLFGMFAVVLSPLYALNACTGSIDGLKQHAYTGYKVESNK